MTRAKFVGSFLHAGRIILVTQRQDDGPNDGPVWIVALTPAGDLTWEYLDPEDASGESDFRFVATDEALLITSSAVSWPAETLLVSAEGELLASTRLASPDASILSTTQSHDGGYILGGECGGSACLWKLNAEGELSWERTFDRIDGIPGHIVPFGEGYLLASWYWRFAFVNETGEVLWRHVEPMLPRDHSLVEFVTSPSGEALAIGYSQDDEARTATAIQFTPRCP